MKKMSAIIFEDVMWYLGPIPFPIFTSIWFSIAPLSSIPQLQGGSGPNLAQ